MPPPSRSNPFTPPGSQRVLPVLHWRETVDETRLASARAALAEHCADRAVLAADRVLAIPRLRGMALMFGALSGATLLISVAIAGLATVINKDRLLLIGLAGLCAGLTVLFALLAWSRRRRDRRLAEQDRDDPRATVHAYLHGLRSGAPGEALVRLCPDARQTAVEAPPVGPHRSRRVYRLADPQAMVGWCKTFARSDPTQPRWLFVREATLERRSDDLAVVRLRFELRWWALWGALAVAVMALFLLFFAVIPALILYLALMQRQPVAVSKHLLYGGDGRWYLLRPEILPTEV